MKVNRKRKVAMTCDEYLQSHKSVKMCHEWDVWDELEADEHFSLKSGEGSFESDKGSFESDEGSFESDEGSFEDDRIPST